MTTEAAPVEGPGAPVGTALAVHTHSPTPALSSGQRVAVTMLRPLAPPEEVLKLQEETRDLVTKILQPGRDYGTIPGTDKPSMLKPGAERVALAFGCFYGEPEILEKEIDHNFPVSYTKRKKVWRNATPTDRHFDWKEESGTSFGLYRYVLRVPVIERASGAIVGYGIGAASTMESKYIDRPRDGENTVLKMAHKRGIIGGCLVTFGLSEQFTQDVEDLPKEAIVGENAPDLPAMDPPCPKCGGKMVDQRLSKKNPKAPDFKCVNAPVRRGAPGCEGVIWPPREGEEPREEADILTRAPDPATAAAPVAPPAPADPLLAIANNPDEVTEAQALAAPLYGKPGSWGNHGGKPLSDVPEKVLRAAYRWFGEKLDEDDADMSDPPLSEVSRLKFQAMRITIPLVLTKLERDQGQLPLADPPSTPNSSSTVDGDSASSGATPGTRRSSATTATAERPATTEREEPIEVLQMRLKGTLDDTFFPLEAYEYISGRVATGKVGTALALKVHIQYAELCQEIGELFVHADPRLVREVRGLLKHATTYRPDTLTGIRDRLAASLPGADQSRSA